MHIDEIRKIAKARPFRPFEMRIDTEEKYLILHPENIFITNQLIVTADEQGFSILITPEAISTIRMVDSAQNVDA